MINWKKKIFIYAPIALSLVILTSLVYPNLAPLAATLKTAHPGFLCLAFFFACMSYLFMGFSLWEVLKILGHRLPFWETTGVAFVSTTVNYFVSSGGVSGFATRAHLLSKRKIPYGISVTSSVVISVFVYLVLSIIIVEGMVLQLLKTDQLGTKFFEGIAGVLFVLSFAFVLVLMFFHHELRSAWARKIYHAVNHLLFFFSKKEIPEETFNEFESQLSAGIQTIHSRKYELPLVLGYVCLDWICNIFILNFAFRAVGVNMGSTKLIIGFAFGQLMTVIPLLPGGLGAMEAAMTAVYSQMGVSIGQALAATLIFRFLYYLVPSFASIFVYWGLKMSESRHHGRPAGDGASGSQRNI
ncbi:MAG: lysylphosphatidylglycerol synthase transmembrane domain-containing protein [Elusimicrobiota bacterium]